MSDNKLFIQFGTGGNAIPGWKNHDADVDISKRLPYGNEQADFIFAEHVAEHINSHEFLYFCDECYRILKFGGTLRLCMPILERLDRAAKRDIILNHGHQASYSPQVIRDVLEAAGFDRAKIRETDRKDIDQHWKMIGHEKDDRETCRIEATK